MITITASHGRTLARLVLAAAILVVTPAIAVAGPVDYWPKFNRDLLNTGVADPALAGMGAPVEIWSHITDNLIGSGSPVVADIDNDGQPEVLVPTATFAGTGGIYALNADGTLKWKYQTGDYGTYATPPLADIDGDGKLETVFPSYGGKIIAVNDDGTQMWCIDKGIAGTRSVIADVQGDTALEVVAGAAGKTFLLKASDGSQIWEANYAMLCDPAVADVDGDAKPEVLFSSSGTPGNVIVALNAEDGTVAWTSTAMSQFAQNNLAIIRDINSDGMPDVVAGARDKKLYVFSGADGTKLWEYLTVGRIFAAAVADFDGDGFDDVATTATKADGVESYVYLLDVKDQALLWQHNIVGKSGYTTERSPSIADVNGDGTPDVLVAGLSQTLYALSGTDGSEIWTVATDDPSAGVPAVGDLNGDGVMEILVASGSHVQAFGSPDGEGPVTTAVLATPNPVSVGGTVTLSADIDDTDMGGSNIASAEYSLNSGPWIGMPAEDGAFDEIGEDVTAAFTAPGVPGIYDLCVRGTDAASNTGAQACIMLVAYDPEGGFVTGGGWIDSPVNTDYRYMQVGGRASFGFVAKYKKGASVPEGNTEFQFKAGNLNFHSTSYDWLVVNQGGARAQFKGSGTINGSGDYTFMLWAGDGEPDTFRIKIWYEDGGTEVVVYDNYMEQTIGGGSIVVHTK